MSSIQKYVIILTKLIFTTMIFRHLENLTISGSIIVIFTMVPIYCPTLRRPALDHYYQHLGMTVFVHIY